MSTRINNDKGSTAINDNLESTLSNQQKKDSTRLTPSPPASNLRPDEGEESQTSSALASHPPTSVHPPISSGAEVSSSHPIVSKMEETSSQSTQAAESQHAEASGSVASSKTLPVSSLLPSELIEFNENLKHENVHIKELDAARGRAVTPISDKMVGAFSTSSSPSSPRPVRSPRVYLKKTPSAQSSTDSLQPQLPIVSSSTRSEDSDTFTRPVDVQSTSKSLSKLRLSAESLNTVTSVLPDSQLTSSPNSRLAQHSHSSSITKLQQHPPILRPSPLNFASLGAAEIHRHASPRPGSAIDPAFDIPNIDSHRPSTPSDPSLTRQQLNSMRSPIVLTPGPPLVQDNTPTSSTFPSLENCTFNDLKSMLSEKLIQLSQVQSQNAQLWTLVNKQRTMIFDLQKDLDGAVEQNEKYRTMITKLQSKHSTHSTSSLASTTSNSTLNKVSKSVGGEKVQSSPSSQVDIKKDDAARLSKAADVVSVHSQTSHTSSPLLDGADAKLKSKPSRKGSVKSETKQRPPPISVPSNNVEIPGPKSIASASTQYSDPITPVVNGPLSTASRSTFELSDATPLRKKSSVSRNFLTLNLVLTLFRNLLRHMNAI